MVDIPQVLIHNGVFLKVAKPTEDFIQWHMLMQALHEQLRMEMESPCFLILDRTKDSIGSAEYPNEDRCATTSPILAWRPLEVL